MKKLLLIFGLIGSTWLSACSNEKSGANNAAAESGTTAENDSSTTNPINSEYGTPNASENPVDSAQSAKQDSTRK
ncbi:hypothetical protein AHMF7605_20745 [Adhaeribacter arboris]|uniref:Coproporphyrinogen III oxidase n=1 Tax=Adhaeribacter arboris TaxID=2072846 RepID=A0A2T2YJR6_9BACT|nr:hypothetical protein [Adhaeribacter arboris]PSR55756.1 hypothetical protein AHMF7605_20745 [Adhaeribacter arboris]